MTMQGGTWRRTEMVGWLVTCATEIGLSALMSVIKVRIRASIWIALLKRPSWLLYRKINRVHFQ